MTTLLDGERHIEITLHPNPMAKGEVEVVLEAEGRPAERLGVLVEREDGYWFSGRASAQADINGYVDPLTAMRVLFSGRALAISRALMEAKR